MLDINGWVADFTFDVTCIPNNDYVRSQVQAINILYSRFWFLKRPRRNYETMKSRLSERDITSNLDRFPNIVKVNTFLATIIK